MLTATGDCLRQFKFSSPITDTAICSTFPGSEGNVAGLADDQIVQILVNHRFRHVIVKHDKSTRSIGVSMMRTKIAVIDSTRRCCVYDAIGSQLLFIEEPVDEFVWNQRCDDLIAVSEGECVSVKAYELQRINTKFNSQLVRLSGLIVYALKGSSLAVFDVSLAVSVKGLTRNNDFVRAYELASFGFTEENWNELADAAIRLREHPNAIRAADHARNLKLLNFIDQIPVLAEDYKFTQYHLLAEVDAWTGNFDSAARVWIRDGNSERAVQMFFDVRQFDKLEQFLSGTA
jgi:intraflagellar transport protein 122